jgi:hypothetical protein
VQYTIGFALTSSTEVYSRPKVVQIRVRRPGAIAEPGERRYYTASMRDVERAARAIELERRSPATTRALARLIPLADEPLRLALAAFAPVEVQRGAFRVPLTLALGVDLPEAVGVASEQLQIETRVFDGEGRLELFADRREEVVSRRPAAGPEAIDLLSTVLLSPGRYNIRMSTHSPGRDRSGSVYTDIVIPDFRREALSLSGVVVSVDGRRTSDPGAVASLLPIVPTTTRTFAAGDAVTVFLRVYAGGSRTPAPVELRAELRNTGNEVVFTDTRTVTPEGTSAPRSAEYRLTLPVARLERDEYLLTIDATAPRAQPQRRHVRFWIE